MAKLTITLALNGGGDTIATTKIGSSSVSHVFAFAKAARAEEVLQKIGCDIAGGRVWDEVEVIDNRPQPLISVVDGSGASLKNVMGQDVGEPVGLKIEPNSSAPLASVDIDPGSVRSDDNSMLLKLATTLTASLEASGAGGLDTGGEAASSWYFVWLIHNPTEDTYAGLLSLSDTAPTLPEGYTKKRRVGSIRNNSDGNILNFRMVGRGSLREYRYCESPLDTLQILSYGTASTYTDLDCSSLIPPTSWFGLFVATSMYNYNDFRPNGVTADSVVRIVSFQNGSNYMEMPTDDAQIIEYKAVTGAAAYVSVIGYKEEL